MATALSSRLQRLHNIRAMLISTLRAVQLLRRLLQNLRIIGVKPVALLTGHAQISACLAIDPVVQIDPVFDLIRAFAIDVYKRQMLMSLGVKQGDTVTVTANGADEDAAIEALKACFEANL